MAGNHQGGGDQTGVTTAKISTKALQAAAIIALGATLFPVGGAVAAEPVDTALSTCWSCHGVNAPPKDPMIPIIQGQQAAYLEKQLRDFRSGARESQIMSSMAESLRPADIGRAAAIISAMTWPKHNASAAAPDPEVMAACRACHGAELQGGPGPEGVAPRLAGQFSEYLADRMNAYARGEHPGAKTMTALMKAQSEPERTRIAKYLSGL
jgi:cytochrome c553